MTDKNYKDLIYSIIVPQELPQEEQNVRYQPLVDFLQTETPSSLYRFRECNENSISAFDQDQIWFAPGSEMNDDFDALLFLDRNTIYSNLERSLASFGAEIPNSVLNSFPDDVAASVQAQFKQMSEAEIDEFRKQLHCFLVNRLDANMPRIEHIIQSVLKFACFSETIDSAAMWGYYANSGTGFALAYDFRNQNYTDCTLCEKRFLYKRRYEKHLPEHGKITQALTELFKIISMQMLDVGLTETGIDNILRSKLFGEDSYWYSFDDPQFVKQILNQFKAAGLLHSSWNKSKSTLFWSLTKKGVLTRDQMMLIKKS